MSGIQDEKIPEEDNNTTEAPLTMAASVVLTNLPRDASKALESAGNLAVQKSKCSWPRRRFPDTYKHICWVGSRSRVMWAKPLQ
jgi:hypothetical protein